MSSIDRLLAEAYRDILTNNNKALVANLLDFSGKVIVDVDTLEEILRILTGEEHSISTSMKNGDGCKCCGGKATMKLFDSIISIKPVLSEEIKARILDEYGISLTRTYAKEVVSISRSRRSSAIGKIEPVEMKYKENNGNEVKSEKSEKSEKRHKRGKTIEDISEIKIEIPSPENICSEPVALSSDIEHMNEL